MKQILCGVGDFQGTTGWFVNPFVTRSSFQEFPEAQALVSFPAAVTLRNQRLRCTNQPAAGTSRTLTTRKNAANTSLATTVTDVSPGAEDTDATDSVSVAVGDTIAWGETRSGSPGASDAIFSLELEPADPTQSLYGFGGQNTQNATLRYTGLFYASNFGIGWPATGIGTTAASLATCAGTLLGYRIRASTTPGVGRSWTFAVYLNGIKQDGSGGTVDTRGTLTDANFPVLDVSFSLPIAPLDLVEIESSPSGTPTPSRLNGLALFSATIPGQAHFGCSHAVAPTASATRYFWPFGYWNLTGATTESDREQVSNPTTLSLSGLAFRVTGVGATSSDLTCVLRKAGGDTALTVTVPSGSGLPHLQVFTGADVVDITDGEDFTLAVTSAGAVAAGLAGFQVAFVQGVVTPPVTVLDWIPGGRVSGGRGLRGGLASGMTPTEMARALEQIRTGRRVA